jgi:hypothetical protein
MTFSSYVCRRCLLPVRVWGRSDGSTYWKHSGGFRSSRSCGRRPDPVPRTETDEALGDVIRQATS